MKCGQMHSVIPHFSITIKYIKTKEIAVLLRENLMKMCQIILEERKNAVQYKEYTQGQYLKDIFLILP